MAAVQTSVAHQFPAANSSSISEKAGVYDTTQFTGSEGVYLLPHHAKEILRLQTQHKFMNSSTDGTLLATPNLQKYSENPLRVLDAGCADGTWLRDLPRQLPNHELDLFGVDIGASLFPHRDSSSKEPDLRTHSILEPFPSSWEWDDSFDIIHQRLLIWGIAHASWPQVIRNHLAILKPGGYIQLVEAEWIDANNPASLPQLKKQAALQIWSTKQFGFDINLAYQLEDFLKDAGFENVHKIQFDHGYGKKAKAEDQKAVSAELWVECFRSLDTKIPDDGVGIPGVAKDATEFHAFLDALEIEIKAFGYQPKLNFVIGKKPQH